MSGEKDKERDNEKLLEKFANGYSVSDEDKKTYRKEIQDLIDEASLFVAPVQAHNRGQHRAEVYNVIYPLYKSDQFKKTVPNCFACKICKQIFLHLRTKGTAPFTSHKCYKSHNETLKKAEILAKEADKVANEAAAKAESAKKTFENLRKTTLNPPKNQTEVSEVSGSSNNAETQDVQFDAPVVQRPRHAEVVAATIEQFVDMALKGKPVKSTEIIDSIPEHFTRFSWQKFVEKMELKTPYRMKSVKVVLNRIEPQSTLAVESAKRREECSSNSENENVLDPKRPKTQSSLANKSVARGQKSIKKTENRKIAKSKQSKPHTPNARKMRLRSARDDI